MAYRNRKKMTTDELNKLDRFAAENGIVLQADGATATMTVTERHLNGAGVCQGGALFTLADLAAAGVTHGEKLTVQSDIQFLRPGRLGDELTAIAKIVHEGRMALVQTEIRNGSNELVAVVSARFYGHG